MMRFSDRNMSENAYLNDLDQRFEKFKYYNAATLSDFNAKNIRDHIMGLNAKPKPTIIHYIDSYYAKAIGPSVQLSKGIKRNYRKAFKHVKDFLAFRKTKTADLKDLTVSFAYEFRDYLLGNHPNCQRTDMKEPSALDNVKRLRTVFDKAVDEELIFANPFKKIKLKNRTVQRGRLDIHQIKRIYALNLTEFNTQQTHT